MQYLRSKLTGILVVVLLAVVVLRVAAQQLDAGGEIVSEELAIEAAVSPEPAPPTAPTEPALEVAAPEAALETAVREGDLPVPGKEPAADPVDQSLSQALPESSEASLPALAVEVEPPAAAEPAAAVAPEATDQPVEALALEVVEEPEAAPEAEPAAAPETVIDAGAAATTAAAEPAAEDAMAGLEVEESAVAAPPAAPAAPAVEAEPLAGLEVAPAEPVPAAKPAPEPAPAAVATEDELVEAEATAGGKAAVAAILEEAEVAATETPGAKPAPEGTPEVEPTVEPEVELAVEPVAPPAAPAVAPALEAEPLEETLAESAPVELAPEPEAVAPVVAPRPPAAAPVARPVAPVAPAVPAPVAAAPARPLDPRDRAVQVLRESEELRRKAFRDHAMEKMDMADAAMKAGNFADAQRYFEQAINALDQAGSRPENRAIQDRARVGMRECLYRRALVLRKEGDLDGALKLAREASLQGHAKAPALVERIEKDRTIPPPPPPKDRPVWKTDTYKTKVAEVGEKLRRGREHYYANELDKAQEYFENVLAIDPHNTEAIRWREKVTQKRFERASQELESTRRDMLTDIRETWNPRDYGAGEVVKKSEPKEPVPVSVKSAADQIVEKMESIIIPEIDFRQANIHDVVQFLNNTSIECDRSTDGRKGVNLILNLGAAEQAPVASAATDEWGAPVEGAGGAAGGPDVQQITFRAREVSLAEALRIVTEVANLKYRIEGNVVIILPFNAPEGKIIHKMYDVLPTTGERINTIRAASAQAQGPRGEFTAINENAVEVVGTDWKAFFTEMGVQWPIGSSIKYVPAIGKLMVANTADNLTVFEQRLAALDIVPKQIEIEARFVEVNQTDLNSLGFEWLLTDDWEIAQKESDLGLPLSQRQRIAMGATSFTKGNRYVTGAGTALEDATDDIFSIASILTNPELAVVLHAMEQKGNADLLSAPKVTTQSGVEATIKVVTEYIYPTEYEIDTGNNNNNANVAGGNNPVVIANPPIVTPAAFETREVGVILTVLPEVSTEGEMINLTMSPEVVSEPTWKDYGQSYYDTQGNLVNIPLEQPFFHTRTISTSILIYNGATVVMGGMITEGRNKVEDKIPFLGDLPLIGRLFRSSYDHSIKKNLLIFVTARLVDPAGQQVGARSGRKDAVEGIIAPAPEAAPTVAAPRASP